MDWDGAGYGKRRWRPSLFGWSRVVVGLIVAVGLCLAILIGIAIAALSA